MSAAMKSAVYYHLGLIAYGWRATLATPQERAVALYLRSYAF